MGNGKPEGVKKRQKTRIPGRKLKFLASVCFRGLPSASAGFRLLPRPLGRGGFVRFGFYPIDGVGKCGGGGRILENWKPQGVKNA